MTAEQLEGFAKRVQACWSLQTASTYTATNPAKGQCSVTALLVQEKLGGNFLKTWICDAWHFYNQVDGERLDLTSSQFDIPMTYDDTQTTRKEVVSDTSPEQLLALRISFQKQGAEGS